ncbi:aspartate kinase [Candidatus Saccharibacteria bacterium]|nr:aspartate kinase [Candidatus Saccharibacteria bacterium]
MKFGGTSIGNAQRIQAVAKIVASWQKTRPVVVVVSAMNKVTDLLVASAESAAKKKRTSMNRNLKQLRRLHLEAISGLGLTKPHEQALLEVINVKFEELEQLLSSVYIIGELSPRALDAILCHGERLSIHLVTEAIRQAGLKAEALEASSFIRTTDQFGAARPLLEESEKLAKKAIMPLLKRSVTPVVTGYIGSTSDGIITTLGRGGSDYSATILGYCLGAEEVWIWTDVDGVMTADPAVVKQAHTLRRLSYNEAAELSYFGAKVLHPLTMVPAALKQIPILIKNSFNPKAPGTKISEQISRNSHSGKAIATIGDLSLITVQGKGMIGVPGVAAKVFGAIAAQNINVLFISQASSEYNISFVVAADDGQRAVRILQETFEPEVKLKLIETVRLEEKLAILAVVGEGMRGHPGIAGKIFSALGNSGVNIIAIAQGSSERNISLVIKQANTKKAVNSIHQEFHLAKP